MDIATINQPEQLRSWVQSGLFFAYSSQLPPDLQSIWDALFAKHEHASPYVITYPELGYDLGGQADPSRRAFLGSMMSQLAKPKGSFAFWPLAIYYKDELVSSLTNYWQGLARLCAQHLLIFGPTTAEQLFSLHLDTFTTTFIPPYHVTCLPDLSTLMRDPDTHILTIQTLLDKPCLPENF